MCRRSMIVSILLAAVAVLPASAQADSGLTRRILGQWQNDASHISATDVIENPVYGVDDEECVAYLLTFRKDKSFVVEAFSYKRRDCSHAGIKLGACLALANSPVEASQESGHFSLSNGLVHMRFDNTKKSPSKAKYTAKLDHGTLHIMRGQGQPSREHEYHILDHLSGFLLHPYTEKGPPRPHSC